ncbi:acyl-CoA dehydrogenase family protein [Steroidobacter sp. S1-65]|uniref:Acyl-CoA dehydrogenase family protein n=1 Tax=Steroidobacter gossypii TaxID=2805490 RepID=A0ABS1X5C8_9GAMM|nr:acyl-CoA dehydrogenase family protein [Steroidobacter gossypii]MBM0108425.1 acyl-CoA dehydrogenase family protein [Steroidobacter gossypii]
MQSTVFIQSPPMLGNQYGDDTFLRSYLQRRLPAEVLAEIEPSLSELGALAGGELYRLQLQDRLNEPTLTQWDAWGNRIDRIEVSPLWQRAAQIAATHGLIAIPYERRHGRYSRIHQFAAVYLFHPSSDVYTCPLAMTDGAARTLSVSGNRALIDRAVTRLTSRDPAQAWTSGQWMTESTGGSDVGASLTRAVRDDGGRWRLFGKKWFTSAITSQMALTLARPEGNGPGGSGLAMFYVETHNDDGSLNGIRVERLKDKLGTRKVPTAELMLEGAYAELVGDTRHGTKNIEPMLTVTRAWNSVTSVSFMRRALMLARSYAAQRRAFGARLEELPLHIDTLAGLEAETRGAFLLAFELVELMGRQEAGELSDSQRALLRLITPIAKLLTAKQAVAVVSECIEAFGGAGYVEDTGLPMLLRDTQVLPIWEGTTNVLALDALLRGELAVGLPALRARIEQGISTAVDDGNGEARLVAAGRLALAAVEHVGQWLSHNDDPRRLQAHARRLAMTLGRALQLALLIEHAGASNNAADTAAVGRFAAAPLDLLVDINSEDSARLIE